MKNKTLGKNSKIKITISSKSQDNNIVDPLFRQETIVFYQQLIENTIIYLHKNRENNLITNHELNSAIESLERNYKILKTVEEKYVEQGMLKDDDNKKIIEIKQSLTSVILLNGTTNIRDIIQLQNTIPNDMANVYASKTFLDCKLNDEQYSRKFNLLEKYVRPINVKILSWTNNQEKNVKKMERNKIIDDDMILDHSDNLDCFDLSRTSKEFYIKVNGIKTVIHNYTSNYSIIIECIVDNIMLHCIRSQYICDFLNIMKHKTIDYKIYSEESYSSYIESLTLKDILIYSDDELVNKYYHMSSQIVKVKQNTISQVVRDFITDDLYKQRNMLISLLLYSEQHEYQYMAYLLYDLLSNDSNGEVDTTEHTMILNILPGKIKYFFRSL